MSDFIFVNGSGSRRAVEQRLRRILNLLLLGILSKHPRIEVRRDWQLYIGDAPIGDARRVSNFDIDKRGDLRFMHDGKLRIVTFGPDLWERTDVTLIFESQATVDCSWTRTEKVPPFRVIFEEGAKPQTPAKRTESTNDKEVHHRGTKI